MLVVRQVSLSGYRSLRHVTFDLEMLNVFVGRNGAGKTNLYRGLELLQAAALGTFSREIAGEGGMAAALWAGPRRKTEAARIALSVELALSFSSKTFYTYEIEAGIRPPTAMAFPLEPQVKEERILFHDGKRERKILERRGAHVVAMDGDGETHELARDLLASVTALSEFDEPGSFPDLHLIRRTLASWRFYHELRTDAASPLRKPCLAVTAPMLDPDGGNLAAVFATLRHIREDSVEIDAAISSAFPGAKLEVPLPEREASFGLTYAEFVTDGGDRRVFEARELSDGTLRFLGLAGALLSYHQPPFIAVNEPEGSLHPELMRPLAEMIVQAASQTQVWVVTHSEELASELRRFGSVSVRDVNKRNGATEIA